MGEQAKPLPTVLKWFCVSLFGLGLIARLAPLLDRDGRLMRQFPTEDGYLMLTIARNLGLGHGMSTANGTMPTNGTQPLFNFIEAFGFYVAAGNRRWGVSWALAWEILLSCVCAYGLFLLLRQTLRARSVGVRHAAWLGSALWFASPVLLPHTMNCLETGLYGTSIVYCVYVWQRLWLGRNGTHADFRGALSVGALLGVAFWARIDAVFLIAAVTAVHTALGFLQDRSSFAPRFRESLTMGSVAVAIALPWLVSNFLNFGSPMPISGTAQSLTATFGGNLVEVPSKLVEYAMIVLPIPKSIETRPVALVAEAAVLVLYGVYLWQLSRRLDKDEAGVFAVFATLGVLLIGYYGLAFGASHFVDRYLFPTSLPLTMTTAIALAWLLDRFAGAKVSRIAALSAVTCLAFALHLRLYVNGKENMHFQVVDYVREHVGEDQWVGAIQTGTLGFFHDRTVNLDGKVNPDALRMALARRIPHYVVEGRFGAEQRPIEWLADWSAIGGWIEFDPISTHFQLIVKDEERNLAVLKRR